MVYDIVLPTLSNMWIYPLVNKLVAIENCHLVRWFTYLNMVIFQFAMLNYQRVSVVNIYFSDIMGIELRTNDAL